VREDLDFLNINDAETKRIIFHDRHKKFTPEYKEYIYKSFHGIDEKAYYLFKYAYELERRYTYEPLEEFNNFNDYIPIFVE
jgi:hypothetical protein